MRNHGLTSAIAILFLGILLGVKALDYHSLTHAQDSDAAQCELCLFSHINESLSFDRVPGSSGFTIHWDKPYEQVLNALTIITVEEFTYSFLFGRPPPPLV